MRKKRNSNNSTLSTKGYIYKYFGHEIARILVPNIRFIQNCEVPYVSHPEAEDVLSDYLEKDSLIDKSLIFTGLTGSGKTTIIRHVFHLEDNANEPHFTKDRVVIPIDFNRSQKSADIAILTNIRSTVLEICRKYKIDYPDTKNADFYTYVYNHRRDLLLMDSNFSPSIPHEERLDTFCKQLPSTFASCQLQYVMDDPACDISLVVLVVDNIEAFSMPNSKNVKSRYLAPVIEAFKLAECIGQRSSPTKWRFNMVIACRHHIWRIMKGEFTDNIPDSALLQSYITTETPYDLAAPVMVNDIVKKRDEVFARKANDPIKWQTAANVVKTILKTMENTIGDFVLQLSLKDIRKSLAKLNELVLHRGLQRKSDAEIETGAFQIDSVEQFDLTRVNLIRTIGLGNRKYYSGANSIIPNLLYNERQEGLELYPLLTLKYFLIRCDFSEPAWDNPVSIPDFYEEMKTTFRCSDHILNSIFGRSVQFLIQHRLLLRSADQPQDEVPGLTIEEANKVEHVYVSGSAVKLWKELENSSALFQLFLDDIWLDESGDYFEDDGNDIEHCVMYLHVLLQVERRIFNSASNLSTRCAKAYIKNFGPTPVCKQLLMGLISSLKAIKSSGDSNTQTRIRKAIQALSEAEKLLNDLKDWNVDY